MTNKITCRQHRTFGLALAEGKWICRGCKLPHRIHETTEETVARNHAVAIFPVGAKVVILAEGYAGLTGTVSEVHLPERVGNPGYEIVTMLDFTVDVPIGHDSTKMNFIPHEIARLAEVPVG